MKSRYAALAFLLVLVDLLLYSCDKLLPRARLLITYGDAAYSATVERLMGEAASTAWFEERRNYNSSHATRLAARSPATLTALLRHKRGGGYWLWKPLVIKHALESLHDGEVLMYIDAGCRLHPVPAFDWLLKRGLLHWSPIQVCSGWGQFTNRKMSRPDVMRAILGAEAGGAFAEQPQTEGNRVLIRKTALSVALVDHWARLALDSPWMFTDSETPPPQPGHHSHVNASRAPVDHRHDQSVLSALLHLHNFSRGTTWLLASPDRLRHPPFRPCLWHSFYCWPYWLMECGRWPLRLAALTLLVLLACLQANEYIPLAQRVSDGPHRDCDRAWGWRR